jgi:hypothetical protein
VRLFLLAVLLAHAAPGPAAAADRDRREPVVFAAAKTGKERLGDKASDDQRVDDCKVPPARRTRARPADCPWDVRS